MGDGVLSTVCRTDGQREGLRLGVQPAETPVKDDTALRIVPGV